MILQRALWQEKAAPKAAGLVTSLCATESHDHSSGIFFPFSASSSSFTSLGHFLVARFYGVRVLTFSLGFGPKLLKFTRGATEYCISAVPLGGYVKLAGETVQDQRSGEPDEFLSKSKWVRFQVYLAGPVMNLGLALVVVAIVLSLGADVPLYQSSTPVIGTVAASSAGEAAGLKIGDHVLTVNGRKVSTWDELAIEYLPKANQELEFGIMRAGQPMKIHVTPRATGKYEIGDLGIGPSFVLSSSRSTWEDRLSAPAFAAATSSWPSRGSVTPRAMRSSRSGARAPKSPSR